MGSDWSTGVRAVVAAFVLFASLGCSSADTPEPTADPAAVTESVARSVDTVESSAAPNATVLDDPGINAEGVIFAAVVLRTGGDVEQALAAGAFSRADLDAARDALADGSLDYLFD